MSLEAKTREQHASDNHSIQTLAELFTCIICMEKLQDAHLCPHCSKLCCYHCIRRWLFQQRSQCPHCQAPLQLHEVVHCRWAEEVIQQLDNLQAGNRSTPKNEENDENKDRCEAHSEKFSVYCEECKVAICHRCALWGSTHSGHTFKPLEEACDQNVKVAQLKKKLTEFINLSQEVEKSIESVRSINNERAREIENAVKSTISRLDSRLKAKSMASGEQKNVSTQETERSGTISQEADGEQSLSSTRSIAESNRLSSWLSSTGSPPLQRPPPCRRPAPRFASPLRRRHGSPTRSVSPPRRIIRISSPSSLRRSHPFERDPPVKTERGREQSASPRPSTSRAFSNESPALQNRHTRLPEEIVIRNDRSDTRTTSIPSTFRRAENLEMINLEELNNVKVEVVRPELPSAEIIIRRRNDEGRRPIFDRDEIKQSAIKFGEEVGSLFNGNHRFINDTTRESPHVRDTRTRETDQGRDRERHERSRSNSRSPSPGSRSLDRSIDDRERYRRNPHYRMRTRTSDSSPDRRDNNRSPGGGFNWEPFYENEHTPYTPHPVSGFVPVVVPHFVTVRPPRPTRFMPSRIRPSFFKPPGPGFNP